MTNYARGARFENKIKRALEKAGWICIRSAGSKGKVDVVAFKTVMIQCKLGKIGKDEEEGLKLLTQSFPHAQVRVVTALEDIKDLI